MALLSTLSILRPKTAGIHAAPDGGTISGGGGTGSTGNTAAGATGYGMGWGSGANIVTGLAGTVNADGIERPGASEDVVSYNPDTKAPPSGSSDVSVDPDDDMTIWVTASSTASQVGDGVALQADPSNDTLEEITVTASKPDGGGIFTKYFSESQGFAISFKPTGTPGSAAYYNSIPASLNPRSVPIKASGNTVTVYLVQSGARDAGHLAYSINGSVAIGLTAVSSTAVWNDPGYASIGINNDPADGTVVYGTQSISVAEATSLQGFAANMEAASVNNSQSYNLILNNCAEAVSNALSQSGDIAGATLLNEDPDVVFAAFMSTSAITGTLVGGGKFKP